MTFLSSQASCLFLTCDTVRLLETEMLMNEGVGSNICEAGSVRLKMSGSYLVNRYFSGTFYRNVFRFDNLLLV